MTERNPANLRAGEGFGMCIYPRVQESPQEKQAEQSKGKKLMLNTSGEKLYQRQPDGLQAPQSGSIVSIVSDAVRRIIG